MLYVWDDPHRHPCPIRPFNWLPFYNGGVVKSTVIHRRYLLPLELFLESQVFWPPQITSLPPCSAKHRARCSPVVGIKVRGVDLKVNIPDPVVKIDIGMEVPL